MLEIRVLGHLDIASNGQSIQAQLPLKAQAALVYLACASQEISRNTLAGLLWTEKDPARAQANLRSLLERMPAFIKPYFTITRNTLSFNREQVAWVDKVVLEEAIKSTTNLNNLRAANRLERALALYRGGFLTGFNAKDSLLFEEWVEQETKSLHQMMCQGYERLVDYYIQVSNYATAITAARRLLEFEPLSEKTHRQLIWLLAATGQRGLALKHYEDLDELLQSEQDIRPQAITTQLYNQILDDEVPQLNSVAEGEVLATDTIIPPQLADLVRHLKRTSLFAESADEVLLEVARSLVRVEVAAGQVVFEKGAVGRCMYIVIAGRVRVHEGDRLLNDLEAPAIFGEQALLDDAPRLATVTTTEDTVLLQLNQDDLYELMMERREVMYGIIRVLSKRLRERAKDVIQLKGQLQALHATGLIND